MLVKALLLARTSIVERLIMRLLTKLEVDRAVLFSLLDAGWTLASSPISALLVATCFSREVQGYYYTFGGLLALQIFVELGLGRVIVQFASHEWSKLDLDADGNIVGEPEALSRLQSLAKLFVGWYLTGGLILLVGLAIGGSHLFRQASNDDVYWILPWLAICFLTTVKMALVPITALLEGCNQVTTVYGYSLAINLISRCGTWTAMLVGANLWTTSVASLLSICFTSGFLKKRYWPFFRTLFLTKPSGPRVSWRNEIWPFQWRIALSWASGYFSFSLFTPILFAYQGPVVAGKFGLTWALVGVLGSLSNSWLSPKVPKFGMLIARRDYQELDRLFFRTTKAVIGVCSLAAVGIGCGIYVLTWFYHALADRLLAPLPLGILLLAQIVLCVSTPFSTYLRAHKREPLLVLSIIGGVATGLSTFLLGKYYSVDAVCFGYFSVTVLLCPLVLVIWHTCRKAWHNS